MSWDKDKKSKASKKNIADKVDKGNQNVNSSDQLSAEKARIKEEAHKKSVKDLKSKFQKKIAKASKENDALQQSNTDLQNQIDALKNELAKANESVTQAQNTAVAPTDSKIKFGGKVKLLGGFAVFFLKNPLTSLSMLKLSNLKTLKSALGKESILDITQNFKKFSSDNNRGTKNDFDYNIENFFENADGTYSLFGWITHKIGVDTISLVDSDVETSLMFNKERPDVASHYPDNVNNLNVGFEYGNLNLEDLDTSRLVVSSKENKTLEISLLECITEIKEKAIESTVPVAGQSSLIAELAKFQNKSKEFYKGYQKKEVTPEMLDALKLITFYLPQFHQIPENDKWWGKGFTEWTNVTQAVPKFEGHFQPRLPSDLGFYRLDEVENIRKQIEIAKNYGIHGFAFHHYWFSGKRLLEKPLDLFLKSDIDFNFCICWANENWTRRWDGMDNDILIAQEYSEDDPVKFIEDLYPYLSDDRYIKLGDKHLIIIYRPSIIPDIKAAVEIWRSELKKRNIDPLFACVLGFGLKDPREVGFDIALEFPPHKIAANLPNLESEIVRYDSEFVGNIHDYGALVERARDQKPEEFPLIRGLFPSWDNEARKKGKGSTVFVNANPTAYAEWLEIAGRFALKNKIQDQSVVLINAWNEWAEGAYLEPDKYNGYAYLETTHNVLRNLVSNENTNNKIVLVSHDAYKHGAQVLVYNIGKCLTKQFGYEVTYLLMKSGPMLDEFRAVANTFVVTAANKKEIMADLVSKGYNTAIINSAVSGLVTKDLKTNGFHCTNLIHELPNIIKKYNIEVPCEVIHEYSDQVIFPSKIVQDGFLTTLSKEPNGKELVKPQGIFNFDISKVDQFERGQLRKHLKIDKDTKIVGGIGFGDKRKGIDLFVELAKMVSANKKVAFVWIGPIEQSLVEGLDKYIADNKLKNIVHFLPYQDDLKAFSIDFDIFTLTSREDPFPSVIIESLALGVPVVAFNEAGGFVDLNKESEILQLAKYLDLNDMQSKVEKLIEDDVFYKNISQKGIDIALKDYQFDNYCFNLAKLNSTNKKVSVIVPNYNYANELEERLVSIWKQTYPVFEVIVLDDNSTDNSVEVIKSLATKYHRKIKLVVNEKNSGSVFSQWEKGINLSKGDFIWMAEADDSAEVDFLETLIKFFEDDKVGMAFSQSKQIDGEGKLIANDYHYYTDQIDDKKWHKDYSVEGMQEIKEGMSIRNTILNVSSVLFKSSILKETIKDNIEFVKSNFKVSGDWYLYVKLLEKANIGYSAKPLNIHRRHTESTTSRNNHLNEVLDLHKYVSSKIDLPKEIMDKRKDEIKVLENYFGEPS